MAELLEDTDKLLGDFIGWQPAKTWMGVKGYVFQEAKFKTDWNWLMSVVEKAESLGAVEIVIGAHDVLVIVDEGSSLHKQYKFAGKSKIDTVHEALVDFIRWVQA